MRNSTGKGVGGQPSNDMIRNFGVDVAVGMIPIVPRTRGGGGVLVDRFSEKGVEVVGALGNESVAEGNPHAANWREKEINMMRKLIFLVNITNSPL